MYGWMGKILRIDLSNSSSRVEPLDPNIAEAFIGGRGLGSKCLLDEIDPKINPLDSGNKLIFATGPVTGTASENSCACDRPFCPVVESITSSTW